MRKSNCNTVSLISGAGESHRARRRASENAANTFSGATANRRRTSTRVPLVIARRLRQQTIELRDSAGPERLMACDPSAGVLQRLAAQSKQMHASFNATFDQPGLLLHFEMLGNRRLR